MRLQRLEKMEAACKRKTGFYDDCFISLYVSIFILHLLKQSSLEIKGDV